MSDGKSACHKHPSSASLGTAGERFFDRTSRRGGAAPFVLIGFRRGRPSGPFQDPFLGRNVFYEMQTAPVPWAIDDEGSPAVFRGRHSHSKYSLAHTLSSSLSCTQPTHALSLTHTQHKLPLSLAHTHTQAHIHTLSQRQRTHSLSHTHNTHTLYLSPASRTRLGSRGPRLTTGPRHGCKLTFDRVVAHRMVQQHPDVERRRVIHSPREFSWPFEGVL